MIAMSKPQHKFFERHLDNDLDNLSEFLSEKYKDVPALDDILKTAMLFDVMGGVSRRAWARNEHAISTSEEYNHMDNNSHITIPHLSDEDYIKELVKKQYKKGGL